MRGLTQAPGMTGGADVVIESTGRLRTCAWGYSIRLVDLAQSVIVPVVQAV
jgi:hypothetical protein